MAESGQLCEWCLEAYGRQKNGATYCLTCKRFLCHACAYSHKRIDAHHILPTDKVEFCDACSIENANAFCWVCKIKLCDQCLRKHKSAELTKEHAIEYHEHEKDGTRAYVTKHDNGDKTLIGNLEEQYKDASITYSPITKPDVPGRPGSPSQSSLILSATTEDIQEECIAIPGQDTPENSQTPSIIAQDDTHFIIYSECNADDDETPLLSLTQNNPRGRDTSHGDEHASETYQSGGDRVVEGPLVPPRRIISRGRNKSNGDVDASKLQQPGQDRNVDRPLVPPRKSDHSGGDAHASAVHQSGGDLEVKRPLIPPRKSDFSRGDPNASEEHQSGGDLEVVERPLVPPRKNGSSRKDMHVSVIHQSPGDNCIEDNYEVLKDLEEDVYEDLKMPPTNARHDKAIPLRNAALTLCITFMEVLPDGTILLYDKTNTTFILYDSELTQCIWTQNVIANVYAICTCTVDRELRIYTGLEGARQNEIVHFEMEKSSNGLCKKGYIVLDYQCSGLTSCYLGIAILQNMTKGRMLLHIYDFNNHKKIKTLPFDLQIPFTEKLKNRKDRNQRFSLTTIGSCKQVVITDCKYSLVFIVDVEHGTQVLKHTHPSLKAPSRMTNDMHDNLVVFCEESRNVHFMYINTMANKRKCLIDTVLLELKEWMPDGICYSSSRETIYISQSQTDRIHLYKVHS